MQTQNQKDLSMLRDRIELLDSTQRHQLDELKTNSALYTSAAVGSGATPHSGQYAGDTGHHSTPYAGDTGYSDGPYEGDVGHSTHPGGFYAEDTGITNTGSLSPGPPPPLLGISGSKRSVAFSANMSSTPPTTDESSMMRRGEYRGNYE